MQQPYSRIIWLECNSQVTSSGQKRNIPSRRVVEVEKLRAFGDAVIGGALCEDDEIMTMKMHGMRGWHKRFGLVCEQELAGNYKINVTSREILIHDSVFWIECRVVKVKDGRIGEIEPGYE